MIAIYAFAAVFLLVAMIWGLLSLSTIASEVKRIADATETKNKAPK